MRLSPFFCTSHSLRVKSLLPPAFGTARRRLQVRLKIRSNGELLFRLVCFPKTWPTINRDREEAGLSLQFHLAMSNMNLQSSATTLILTAAKYRSHPLSLFPLAITFTLYMVFPFLATYWTQTCDESDQRMGLFSPAGSWSWHTTTGASKGRQLVGTEINREMLQILISFSAWCEAKLLSSVFRQHLKYMQFWGCIKRKKKKLLISGYNF